MGNSFCKTAKNTELQVTSDNFDELMAVLRKCKASGRKTKIKLHYKTTKNPETVTGIVIPISENRFMINNAQLDNGKTTNFVLEKYDNRLMLSHDTQFYMMLSTIKVTYECIDGTTGGKKKRKSKKIGKKSKKSKKKKSKKSKKSKKK